MTETQQTMTEFTYATGETDVTGDRFSPSVVLFWLKTSVAASNMRVMYKSPNTLLGVIPLGSNTQTIPLRNIASVDTNTKFNLGSFVWGAVFLIAALAAGLALILALIVWFWTDHAKPDFVPCFWGSIGVIVASIIIRAFAEWILERPTRAERRAMKRAAAPTFDSRL